VNHGVETGTISAVGHPRGGVLAIESYRTVVGIARGVRMALGASRTRVVTDVLKGVAAHVGHGLTTGLVGAARPPSIR